MISKFSTRAAAIVVAAVILVGSAAPAFATFGDRDRGEGVAEATVPKKVVVLSLPYVTWQDFVDNDLPTLEGFVSRASTANLVVRSAVSVSTLARGYATLGAGTRADAGSLGPAAFNTFEEVDNSTACQTFRRRSGFECRGRVLQIGIADVIRANDTRNFGAVAGELGSALDASGIETGVYGNADGPALTPASRLTVADVPPEEQPSPEGDVEATVEASPPELDLGREVSLAAMDAKGRVAYGAVSEELLEADPTSPYGVRLNNSKVISEVAGDLPAIGVAVVEASDLERVDRARNLATPEQQARLEQDALVHADRLLAGLLDVAPLDETLYILTSPSAERGREELVFYAMAGPGIEPGMATSPSTRHTGIVTLTDIAPTILDVAGVERPASMTGRPITVTDTPNDIGSLVRDNEQSVARDAQAAADQAVFIALIVIVYLAAGVLLWTKPKSAPFAFLSIWFLNVPLSMFLLRFYPFEDFGVSLSNVLVYVMAFVLAGAMWPLRRFWRPLPPVVASALLTGVLMANVMFFGSALEFNSPLGYSAIIAGRFTGFSNLGLGLLIAATIVIGTFIVIRDRRSVRALVATAALFAFVAIVVAAPPWGSNVGGMLGGGTGLGITWLLLTGTRVRVRTLLLIAAALGLVVAGVVVFDLLQPAESRSHLGRLVEQVSGEGGGAFLTVIERKLEANWRILTSSMFVWLIPTTIAFFIALAYQKHGLGLVFRTYPTLGRGMVGALVSGVLLMLVNDSGIAIPAMMMGVIAPTLLYLRAIGLTASDAEGDTEPGAADPLSAETLDGDASAPDTPSSGAAGDASDADVDVGVGAGSGGRGVSQAPS